VLRISVFPFSVRCPRGIAVFAAALLLAPGLLANGARAQETDSTQLRRFRTADAHLQAGKFERAIRILEGLYEESPNNSSFYRKLKEAYESIKQYDDALRLVEERMDGDPTPALLAEKGRLLYQNGTEQEAAQTWEKAISVSPRRPTTYRIVYQTLVELQQFRRAIDVLTQARTRLDNDALFRTELAYLYGLDGQHAEAMREYVALLDQSPNRVGLVRNRLQTFVEQGEGIQSSIRVLTTAVEDAPLNPAYRELLAWLYMTTDDYEAAYDVYRALDRLQQRKGQALFSFAQKAADADQYAVATRALEAILDRHEDETVAPKAQRALGDTYRKWAERIHGASPVRLDSTSRYDAARSAYQTFLERHPTHEAVPNVRAQLGTLQLDVYRALDAAQSRLETVVSTAPQSPAANEARYDLGRIALQRGDFDRARLLFSRLADRLRGGDLADRARFELALLQFYQGQFDGALTRARATSANTSSDVTNDAIDLTVLIQENRGPDSLDTALRLFADARLSLRQHQYDTAALQLDSLLRVHGRHSLADEARFRRAEAQLAQGDTSAALDTYRDLPNRHPRSPYADRSLFRLGELLEERGQPKRAAKVYNQLLSEYPKSLLASDARTRLRTLRRPRG
jgi:tetratricopeptide (TPR) repeat protein